MKLLLILFAINTVAFTVAKLAAIPVWQVLIAEVVLFAVWVCWKAWFSKAQKLVNQAAHMGWLAVGTVRDEDGFRDSLLKRDGVVARVSFQRKCVFIVEPHESGPFKDFVEIERTFMVEHV